MSLRTKFLALFISLGVLPLLALGALSYGQSTRALEGLLTDRTGAIASRAAETLSQSYARSISDLLFLANNAETQRLLEVGLGSEGNTPGGPGSGSIRAVSDSLLAEALSFLDAAWRTVGSSWGWAEIRDAGGSVVHRMGELPTELVLFDAPARLAGRTEYLLVRPIPGAGNEKDSAIGSIRGSLLLQEVLPRGELVAGFGEGGTRCRIRGVRLFRRHRSRWEQAPLPPADGSPAAIPLSPARSGWLECGSSFARGSSRRVLLFRGGDGAGRFLCQPGKPPVDHHLVGVTGRVRGAICPDRILQPANRSPGHSDDLPRVLPADGASHGFPEASHDGSR